MRPAIFLAFAVMALAGCTQQIRQVEPMLQELGENSIETSRAGLRISIWEQCEHARIGALRRELNAEQWEAYELWCGPYWAKETANMELPMDTVPPAPWEQ